MTSLVACDEKKSAILAEYGSKLTNDNAQAKEKYSDAGPLKITIHHCILLFPLQQRFVPLLLERASELLGVAFFFFFGRGVMWNDFGLSSRVGLFVSDGRGG